jgi:hypothetical protein
MKQDVDTQVLVDDGSSQAEPFGAPVGTLLGWYTTADGRRHLRAVETGDCGLCLIDEGSDACFLVEPLLEGMAEAQAIAADYLALASEQREPQTRHPWPRSDDAHERSRS